MSQINELFERIQRARPNPVRLTDEERVLLGAWRRHNAPPRFPGILPTEKAKLHKLTAERDWFRHLDFVIDWNGTCPAKAAGRPPEINELFERIQRARPDPVRLTDEERMLLEAWRRHDAPPRLPTALRWDDARPEAKATRAKLTAERDWFRHLDFVIGYNSAHAATPDGVTPAPLRNPAAGATPSGAGKAAPPPEVMNPAQAPAGALAELQRTTPQLDTGNGNWLSNKHAAKLEGVGVATLTTYRRQGEKAQDGMFGRDRYGRLWRRSGSRNAHPYYYRPTLKGGR